MADIPEPDLFVIVSGEYDSYTRHAVIRGREQAERLLDRINSTATWEPRTYELEPFIEVTADVQPVTLHEVGTEVSDDGTVEATARQSRIEWPFDMLYPQRNVPAGWRWVRAPCHHGEGGRLEVYGTDPDAVASLKERMVAHLLAGGAIRRRLEATGCTVPETPRG